MSMESTHRLTSLLNRMREGDRAAGEQAIELVYGELHRLARNYMRREAIDHTLQPTALVNEAYLRLAEGAGADARDRHHFLAIAATVMRRILVDHARQKQAGKRGKGERKIELEECHNAVSSGVELTELDEQLGRLEQVDAMAARVVEMRFFGGYTNEETAEVLGRNAAKVRRDWDFGRAWLKARLGQGV